MIIYTSTHISYMVICTYHESEVRDVDVAPLVRHGAHMVQHSTAALLLTVLQERKEEGGGG